MSVPPDPPEKPPGGTDPSGAIPRPIDPSTTGSVATTARTRTQTLFSAENPVFRFIKRWGFPLFILLIVIWGRAVLLPFVFAALIAYILAPVVRRMSERKDGTRRMPRSLAIIICYIVFIGGVVGFMFLLVPRLSSDVARLGKEAPGLAQSVDEKWVPELARWLETRFPTLAGVKRMPKAAPPEPSVPLPPGTAFTITPLPDAHGSFAVQIAPAGFDMKPLETGGWHIATAETTSEPQNLEDKLRVYVKKAANSLQSQLDELVVLGQSLLAGFIRGIFMFFVTLMIAAFILIDLEKVHAFLRSLFPANVRDD